jgi:hypothetical protein
MAGGMPLRRLREDSMSAEQSEQGEDQQQCGEGDDPGVPPRHPAKPARRPPGEKPEQTLAPPQTPGPRRRRPDVIPEQIDEARLRLFVPVKPTQIIGIHNVALGNAQHRTDFDAVIAADVKQTAGGADCKIFVLEDIHYYGAAASIRDIPRHPVPPVYRIVFEPSRSTRLEASRKWQG